MLTILCTARDPSSANDLSCVIDILASDIFFVVVADEPALGILNQCIKNKNLVIFKASPDPNFTFTQLRYLFHKYAPDILLTGVSGIGFGIDELALLFARLYCSIPSFSIQSYWGDVNYTLMALPDNMFVLDSYAAHLTKKRFSGINCIVSGPFQSRAYCEFDSASARSSFIKNFSLKEKSICFFGQPLAEFEWYMSTLNSFFSNLPSAVYQYKAFYRPHPKEDFSSRQRTFQLLSKYFDDCLCLPDYNLFAILSGVDLSISLFSTIGYDCQYLNFYSDMPLSVPCYLFFDDSMKNWFNLEYNLPTIPLSADGLSLRIDDIYGFSSELLESFSSEYRLSFHESIKSALPDPHYQDSSHLLSIFLSSSVV